VARRRRRARGAREPGRRIDAGYVDRSSAEHVGGGDRVGPDAYDASHGQHLDSGTVQPTEDGADRVLAHERRRRQRLVHDHDLGAKFLREHVSDGQRSDVIVLSDDQHTALRSHSSEEHVVDLHDVGEVSALDSAPPESCEMPGAVDGLTELMTAKLSPRSESSQPALL
jgi:hypothetical protein